MSPTNVLLGLDLGTSSVKAVLLDRNGRQLGRGRAGHDVRHHGSGAAETDPDLWWSAVRAAVSGAVASADVAVTAIGLSGQMHGVVALDEHGRPLRPAIIWADRRGLEVLPAVRAVLRPYASRLVNVPAPGFAATTLRWLEEHEPATAERITTVLVPKDWLGYRLTGTLGTEPSDASATGLWDFTTDGWQLDAVRALGFDPGILPAVHKGHDVRGPLLSTVADELGLPPGIPVAYGRADVAASQLGLDVELGPGTTTLTMGTGAQLAQVLADQPGRPAAGLLKLAGPHDGQHYVMAGIFSSGLALDWVRRLWSLSWIELFERGLSPAPGELPVFAPFVAGERFVRSDVDLRGAWHGLRASHDATDLVRSALLGTLHTVRLARDRLAADPQAVPVTSCVVSGGGTEDPRLRQLVADVLRVPVAYPGRTDSSARGAAVTATVAGGWCSDPREAAGLFRSVLEVSRPDPDAAERQNREYARFIEVVDALTPNPEQ